MLHRPGRWEDGKVSVTDPGDGPFPWWHVPGQCHNSAPERRDTVKGHHDQRPAVYWWLAPNGYWFAVCAECCARDRRIGAENPDLAAVRITTA
jgi:hypothetical protein